MKGLFRHTWVKWIAVALSLSLIAAAVALVLDGTPAPLRDVGETVSRPFSRLFSAVTGKIRQGEDYVKGVQALRAEKAALEEELAQYKQAALAGELATAENARLRSLLGLQEAGRDLTLVSAWVAARPADNWQGEVTLDRGTSQGLRPGQCVVDQHGALVGRIKEAGETWAAVTLVGDGAFQLAGQGARSGVLGTLEGSLDGELAFTSFAQSDPAQVGEEVVTFAAGESYPSGLAVGRVTALTTDPGGLTRSARLTPAADLDNLTQVFVVTAFREDR